MQKSAYKYSSIMLIGLASLSLTACFDSNNGGDNVIEVNSPPVANDIALVTQTETPVTDSLPVTDPDGDRLTYSVTQMSSLGTVVLDDSGNFTYTPDAETTGIDMFIYSVSDGNSSLVTGMVEITIEALQVSFRNQSRLAFSLGPNDQSVVLNGRNFIQDVVDQNEYQDLIDGN